MFAITNMLALFYWSLFCCSRWKYNPRAKPLNIPLHIPSELHLLDRSGAKNASFCPRYRSCGPPTIYCGRWGWPGIFFIKNISREGTSEISLSFSVALLPCTSVPGRPHEVWHHDCFPLAGPDMQHVFSSRLQYTKGHLKTALFVLLFSRCFAFCRAFSRHVCLFSLSFRVAIGLKHPTGKTVLKRS